MNNTVLKLHIENEEDFLAMMEMLKERKLIGGYYYMKDKIHQAKYPMDIPLEAEKLLDIVCKPAVIMMFGDKIRTPLMKCLEKVVS